MISLKTKFDDLSRLVEIYDEYHKSLLDEIDYLGNTYIVFRPDGTWREVCPDDPEWNDLTNQYNELKDNSS